MPMATKEAQREYNRLWIAKRRANWFLEKYCVQCGSIENLELDHIDPSKKVSHRIWSWAGPRRLVELSKCQVLCKDCHLAKTVEYLTTNVHGRNMYERHGCRCEVCRAAKKLNNDQRTQRIRLRKFACGATG